MKLSVVVMGAPFASQAAYSAYRFTEAALSCNKSIFRVFFYQDAVHTGSVIAASPQDELNLYDAWQALQTKYDLDCVTCIAAAARRGILDKAEMTRHERPSWNHADGFELSGLGQLIEANAVSDRLIVFGA